MAREDDSEEEQTQEAHEPRECMACRGSGSVISNLGGSPNTVECPWCAGTGVRRVGADAQERWLTQDEASDASAGAPASAPDEPSDPAA